MKRRLDGKQKLVAFTAQQSDDIRQYCLQNGIRSESELIRQAVVRYIDQDYGDGAMGLTGIKALSGSVSQLRDMVSVLFVYLNHMHLNLLAYHAEIDGALKDAAYSSAQARLDRFFASFREALRDDPSFFEGLLHDYVAGPP